MANSKGLENMGTGEKQRAQKNKLIVNYWSGREYNIRSYHSSSTILALRKAVVAKPREKEPSKKSRLLWLWKVMPQHPEAGSAGGKYG